MLLTPGYLIICGVSAVKYFSQAIAEQLVIVVRADPDLSNVSMIHAHAIKQMDKELSFQNLHCIGICSAVLI